MFAAGSCRMSSWNNLKVKEISGSTGVSSGSAAAGWLLVKGHRIHQLLRRGAFKMPDGPLQSNPSARGRLFRTGGMVFRSRSMLPPDGQQILVQKIERIRRDFRTPLV